MRIGHGYDAHRLTEGRDMIIGGVKLDYPFGLKAHSDGDVLAHAIIDALLGAAGLPDIGSQFPDNDNLYEGISGAELLKKTVILIRKAGIEIDYIDATILAQRPKMGPHIPKMRENIAAALSIPFSRINIKATTEEKMGFTGREEGISAHAVCICFEKETASTQF